MIPSENIFYYIRFYKNIEKLIQNTFYILTVNSYITLRYIKKQEKTLKIIFK